MTIVLKTRAITGQLVPYNGEHREYTELVAALKDATLLACVNDVTVYVVDYGTDEILGECYGFNPVKEG